MDLSKLECNRINGIPEDYFVIFQSAYGGHLQERWDSLCRSDPEAALRHIENSEYKRKVDDAQSEWRKWEVLTGENREPKRISDVFMSEVTSVPVVLQSTCRKQGFQEQMGRFRR